MKQYIFFALISILSLSGRAQTTVTGKVLDQTTRSPLIGASIVEKDTNNGVTTDFDGNFSINLSDPGASLIVSYLGFINKELVADPGSPATILLLEDAASLEEIIVIGYGSQRKKEITGAVSVISSATIEELKPVRIEQALQGQVAGVQITTQ